MAKPRVWERLSDTTRKRYISKGRSLNQTPEQVRAYYESGGTMGAYRGHKPHYGASERQWAAMVAAARAAGLHQDAEGYYTNERKHILSPRATIIGRQFITTTLENMLGKGFKPRWIIARLREKKDSRDTYHTAIKTAIRNRDRNDDRGYQPGRARYHARPLIADVEIYWYH